MSNNLIPPAFLFRFSVPCLHRRSVWGKNGVKLDPKFRIPSFAELAGNKIFADLRATWNPEGLSFNLRVSGKNQLPWCRPSRLEDSDGLHVWIDTRNTRDIHRASRYCHRFIFLPLGEGTGLRSPVARWLPINRAREDPKPVADSALRVKSEKRNNGYYLEAHLPAAAMTGFDPDEHPNIGFSYAVVDRELGWQTWSVGPEFPFVEDPSLWGTLELTPPA